MKTFKSNGKLLLTGEYVVLDGALALAVPTTYGQTLNISDSNDGILRWKSYNEKGVVWFETVFNLNRDALVSPSDDPVSQRLLEILKVARELNPSFLNKTNGIEVSTHLEFPRQWGLGTSSTLIDNIATWAQVDPYKLLELTFGGSGYDIACAKHNKPITYRIERNKNQISRKVEELEFNPVFKEHLYFVYLNKKQNSRDGIAYYKSVRHNLRDPIKEINTITKGIIDCNTLMEFQELITSHEALISKITRQETIQSKLFGDFKGAIKSLGAWGGDFILVASENNPNPYFQAKGFDTIIPYDKMIK